MIGVRKVTFEEAMQYIKPALRIFSKLAIPYNVNRECWSIEIKIPKYLPQDIHFPNGSTVKLVKNPKDKLKGFKTPWMN